MRILERSEEIHWSSLKFYMHPLKFYVLTRIRKTLRDAFRDPLGLLPATFRDAGFLMRYKSWTCWLSRNQKQNKCCGFHWISCFCRFNDFDDFRYLFGPHFWDIWRSWETILVIFRCSGNSLKFHWFPGPPRIENMDLVEGKLCFQGV